MASILDRIENRKRKNTLKALAKAEYEASRGVQHLAMLEEASERLTVWLKRCENIINNLSNDLEDIQKQTLSKLRITLEKHLIKMHITEIPGIGQSLGSTILHSVYMNTLNDLRHAYIYNGIGETKQRYIDRWVAQYDRKIPALLKQDFPGKSAIISSANNQVRSLQSELIKWEAKKVRKQNKLERVTKEIESLKKVTVDDFIKARVEHEGDQAQIEEFISGVFPEWETMPEWFKEVIQQKEEEDV